MILGVDPGLHSTGLAVCSLNEILELAIVSVPGDLTEDDAVIAMVRALQLKLPWWGGIEHVVVEGQQIYLGKTHNPDSILRLSQVAGACVSWATQGQPGCTIAIPRPKKWKGDIPKGVSAGRSLDHYGILCKVSKDGEDIDVDPCHLSGIKGARDIPAKELNHVFDALGLALWGLTKGKKAFKC